MGEVSGLKCVVCGDVFQEGETETTCLKCGREGILDVLYNYPRNTPEQLKRELQSNEDFSLWRYHFALPVDEMEPRPPTVTGWTPCWRNNRLEQALGIKTLWIKDDGRNPSGSLKDRASAVAVTRAMKLGRKVVACSSTGNAATSMAGMAAACGLRAFIFIPDSAPPAKRTQLVVYGAHVFTVEGSYADAFNISAAALDVYGWYDRNCAINPYLVEGKKTVAWEMAEQSGWHPPEIVFIAIGDGCTVSGVYKGFKECLDLGMIEKMPRLIGVQAEGADPVFRAWVDEKPVRPQEAHTLADSISVGHPKNSVKALAAIRETEGVIITVSDQEILQAMSFLARYAGVFGEPAGVAGFAGLLKMRHQGNLLAEESCGIIVTGNGLKDIPSASRIPGSLHSLPADTVAGLEILSTLVHKV